MPREFVVVLSIPPRLFLPSDGLELVTLAFPSTFSFSSIYLSLHPHPLFVVYFVAGLGHQVRFTAKGRQLCPQHVHSPGLCVFYGYPGLIVLLLIMVGERGECGEEEGRFLVSERERESKRERKRESKGRELLQAQWVGTLPGDWCVRYWPGIAVFDLVHSFYLLYVHPLKKVATIVIQ